MSEPFDQLTLLQQAAVQLHELWLSYMQAGFSPDAALFLCGCACGAKVVPPTSDPPAE